MSAPSHVEQLSLLQLTAPIEEPATGRIHTTVPMVIRGAVVERANRTCQYCGEHSDSYFDGPDGRAWHVDHVVPGIRGGNSDISNLALSCATCNLQKGTGIGHVGKSVKRVKSQGDGWNPRGVQGYTRPGEIARDRILAFYKAHRGAPPTRREVAAALKMSLSTTCYHTLRLVQAGILVECDGKREGYVLNTSRPTTFGGGS